jgi:type II secretory pathway pseudopilin PulG
MADISTWLALNAPKKQNGPIAPFDVSLASMPVPAGVSDAPSMPQYPFAKQPMPEEATQPQGQPPLPYGFTPYTENPEYKAKLGELETLRGVAQKQQQGGVDDYEKLLKEHLARNAKPQMDLSPLLALNDSWFGTNLRSGYSKPQDSKGVLETTANLQGGLQKARDSLTDNQANYLNQQIQAYQRGDQTKAQLLEAAGRLEQAKAQTVAARGSKDEGVNIRARENYEKEFGKSTNALGEFVSSIRDVKNTIAAAGGKIPDPGSPQRAQYDSAVSRMLTRYNADVAKLGALAGGDLNLLTKAVGSNPELIQGWFQGIQRGGAAGTLKVLDGLEKDSDKTVENYGRRIKIWGNRVDDLYANDKATYHQSKGGSYDLKAPASQPSFSKPVDEMSDDEVKAAWSSQTNTPKTKVGSK